MSLHHNPYYDPRLPRARWRDVVAFLAFIALVTGGLVFLARGALGDVPPPPEKLLVSCIMVTWIAASESRPEQHWSERWPAADIDQGMREGHRRAAMTWSKFPGAHFPVLACFNPERIGDSAEQRSPEGGGHPGLNWRNKP